MFEFIKKHFRRTRAPAPAPPAPTPAAAPPARVTSRPLLAPAKFTEPEQQRICDLLGSFHSTREIQAVILEETGKTIAEATVRHYADGKKWQAVIAKARQDFTARLADVPTFHKRVRLERLERQYEAVLVEGGPNAPKRRREIREILSEARQEAERAGTTNILIANIQGLSDAELLERRTAALKRIQTLTPLEDTDASKDGAAA